MDGDFMTFPMHLLDRRIVGVLMRYEEGCFDVAAVWIFALAVEDFFIEANIVVVNGVVESNCDHLRNILGRKITGYRSTILRAEAVRQGTHRRIAWWSSIGIIVHIWNAEKIANILNLNVFFYFSRLNYDKDY